MLNSSGLFGIGFIDLGEKPIEFSYKSLDPENRDQECNGKTDPSASMRARIDSFMNVSSITWRKRLAHKPEKMLLCALMG